MADTNLASSALAASSSSVSEAGREPAIQLDPNAPPLTLSVYAAAPEREATREENDDAWMVWSTEYRLWWRKNRGGYTDDILHAGLYSQAEAERLAQLRSPVGERAIPPSEWRPRVAAIVAGVDPRILASLSPAPEEGTAPLRYAYAAEDDNSPDALVRKLCMRFDAYQVGAKNADWKRCEEATEEFMQIADQLRASQRAPEGRGAEDGVSLIAAERRRQVEAEGWTPAHDDEHSDGQLGTAAECYITDWHMRLPPDRWPWDGKWWKPTRDPVRALVKAGALIAAEIDRINRARASRSAPSSSGVSVP